MLMPADGKRMGIDYNQLQNKLTAIGIGGISHSYVEKASVLFPDSDNLYCYNIDLWIANNENELLMEAPSLLGRDILHQCDMKYQPTKDTLVFSVVTADRVYSLPQTK